MPLSTIKQRLEMSSLRRKLDKNIRLYRKEIAAAEKTGDYRKIKELSEEGRMYEGIYQDSIDLMQTTLLIRQAQRYYIPVPPTDDRRYWRSSEDSQLMKPILKAEGICHVRDAIEERKNKQREISFKWVGAIATIITACTGVVGTLIGLISIIGK